MPRFSFSSYVSKKVLNGVSSLNNTDLDLRDVLKKQDTEESQLILSIASTSIDKQQSLSETCHFKDFDEVSADPEYMKFKGLEDKENPDQLSIEQSEHAESETDSVFGPESSCADPDDNIDGLPEQHACPFLFTGSDHSIECNQSAVNPPSQSEKVETRNPEEEEKTRTLKMYIVDKTESQELVPATQSTVPNLNELTKHATALMFTDEDNYLHPVRNTKDVNNLIPVAKGEAISPFPDEVEDSLKRLQKIPMYQITHFAHLGDYMRHLQANERICDVLVFIGTNKYSAHRISLACFSDFFADMFYTRGEKQRVPLTIRLKGIKPRAFELLLNFIYTGTLNVTPEVIGDLMTMAKNLGITMIKNRIIDFLECLPLAQALSIIIKHKVLFGMLYERAVKAVCDNFITFRHEEVVQELDIETLIVILSSDNLKIDTELEVFRTAVRWMANNTEERRKDLMRLMQCVRFGNMTQLEISQCNEFTDLLKDSKLCKQILLEANWIVTVKMLHKDDPFHLTTQKQRTPLQN
ncbi:uncharacterized protein [Mytilus edulis]|uniref:uncharacterized protein n=1 Tax=Mytilus edulis TaxID=6550 RepID=UPI0039EED2BD